jgi:hypothetical protein
MQGPDVGDILSLLQLEAGDVVAREQYADLAARMDQLRAWAAANL